MLYSDRNLRKNIWLFHQIVVHLLDCQIREKSAEIFSILRSGSEFYTAGISCSKHTNYELDTTVTPESPLNTSHVFLDTYILQVTEVAVVSSCNLITLQTAKPLSSLMSSDTCVTSKINLCCEWALTSSINTVHLNVVLQKQY